MGLTEATVFDLLETVDNEGRPLRTSRRMFGLLARQVAGSMAVTARDGQGRLAAVAGLWPEVDHVEAWFAAGPAFSHAACRALRRALLAVAGDGELGEIRAYLHPSSVAGQRLAAVFGFIPAGETDGPFGRQPVFVRRFA